MNSKERVMKLLNNIFYCAEIRDPSDNATGLEKMELLNILAGKDDPYNMKAIKRGVGTKEQPTLIPSSFDARIIGCICSYIETTGYYSKRLDIIENNYVLFAGDEDQTNVQWMWINKDSPKQCECGYWFKLYHVEPFEDESILATSEIH